MRRIPVSSQRIDLTFSLESPIRNSIRLVDHYDPRLFAHKVPALTAVCCPYRHGSAGSMRRYNTPDYRRFYGPNGRGVNLAIRLHRVGCDCDPGLPVGDQLSQGCRKVYCIQEIMGGVSSYWTMLSRSYPAFEMPPAKKPRVGDGSATALTAQVGDGSATAPTAQIGDGSATAPTAQVGDGSATAPTAQIGNGSATAPTAQAGDGSTPAPMACIDVHMPNPIVTPLEAEIAIMILHGFTLAEIMEQTPGALSVSTADLAPLVPLALLPGTAGSMPGPHVDVGNYPAALLLAFSFIHVVSDDNQYPFNVIGEMLAGLPVPDAASPHVLAAARALFAMSRPQREVLQGHARPLVKRCTRLVRRMPGAPPEDFGDDAEAEWLMHNMERMDWLEAFGPSTRLESLLRRDHLLPAAGGQDTALASEAREYEAKMLRDIYSRAMGPDPREPFYDTVPRRTERLEALLAPHMLRLFGNVPNLLTEPESEGGLLKQLLRMPLAGIAHWVRLKLLVQSENDVALVRKGGKGYHFTHFSCHANV